MSYKAVEWAYPTSTHARQFGYGKTGCYVVETKAAYGSLPVAVAAFTNADAAFAHAATMPDDWLWDDQSLKAKQLEATA